MTEDIDALLTYGSNICPGFREKGRKKSEANVDVNREW